MAKCPASGQNAPSPQIAGTPQLLVKHQQKSETSLLTNLRRLFKHISRRRRWQMVGLLILMLMGAVAEMATLGAVIPFLGLLANPGVASQYPVLQQILAWSNIPTDNLLLVATALFIVATLAAALTRMLVLWVGYRISYGLGADIGSEVYRHTLYQPYLWHISRNSSEIIAAINKVGRATYVIIQLLQGAAAIVICIAIIAMLFAIDAQTALAAAAGFAMLYGFISLATRRKLRRNSKIIDENSTRRIQAIQEGLGGIREIQLDGTQLLYHRRFAVIDYAMQRAESHNALICASPRIVIEGIGMILMVTLAYWLGRHEGGVTGAIPVLGALAIGAQRLLPQMQVVYSTWSGVTAGHHLLDNVLNLLDRPIPSEYNHPLPPRGDSIPGTRGPPLINLRNISFRYKPESKEILRHIDIVIPRGARIGIIGKTGSGKSTLVDLIMGLLEPTAGHIEINGQHLTSQNRRAWQHRIAHVPQAIYLSDTNIAQNIAFGVPAKQIDHTRVLECANKAQLTDFVQSLPQSYQTPVGERGVRLSGGQRQRIGLARALYKRADVLVLDEATSALDNNTEKSVMAAINALGNHITVLMIAHRITTLSDCDSIIEIRGPEDIIITQQGNKDIKKQVIPY
jgi:ABC-type multidrug transport system fused ATPase/permease subunit